jgi:hypothetical protein
MSHFKLLSSSEIFESPVHEDNGVSIGDTQSYLCSATASAALNKARPAGTPFKAASFTNRKWFDKFCKHADHNSPEYVSFSKGLRTNRWYAQAVSF